MLYALYVLCKLFVNTRGRVLMHFFFNVFCAPLIYLSQHQQHQEHNLCNADTFLRPKDPVIINTNAGQ